MKYEKASMKFLVLKNCAGEIKINQIFAAENDYLLALISV